MIFEEFSLYVSQGSWISEPSTVWMVSTIHVFLHTCFYPIERNEPSSLSVRVNVKISLNPLRLGHT